MADLSALIRMRKYNVEQRQKFLAGLYAQENALKEQKETLRAQLQTEQDSAQNLDLDMMRYFYSYQEAVQEQIEDINAHLTQLGKKIEAAREAMREAFAELKKVEITQEARDQEAKAARDKKERETFDEIALQRFSKPPEDEGDGD